MRIWEPTGLSSVLSGPPNRNTTFWSLLMKKRVIKLLGLGCKVVSPRRSVWGVSFSRRFSVRKVYRQINVTNDKLFQSSPSERIRSPHGTPFANHNDYGHSGVPGNRLPPLPSSREAVQEAQAFCKMRFFRPTPVNLHTVRPYRGARLVSDLMATWTRIRWDPL